MRKSGLSLLLLFGLGACTPGAVSLETGAEQDASGTDETSEEAEGDAETETGETESEAGDSETGEPDPLPCSCVYIDDVCGELADEAMYDCALPAPCGTVNGNDAAAAECVLQLLVDQEPARFRYNLENSEGSGGWSGWFYILGPEVGPGWGIDNECLREGWDFGVEYTPSAAFYGLEDPAYFADCIGKSSSVMNGCIFNGLSQGPPIDHCPGS